HADEKGHFSQHRRDDIVAYISRVGYDQRCRGQPTQHEKEMASLAGFTSLAQAPTKRKAQGQMDNRRIPEHWGRTLFAGSSHEPFQLLGTRTCLPCTVAAQGNKAPHLPPFREDRFDTPANSRGQRAENGHWQLGDSLLES